MKSAICILSYLRGLLERQRVGGRGARLDRRSRCALGVTQQESGVPANLLGGSARFRRLGVSLCEEQRHFCEVLTFLRSLNVPHRLASVWSTLVTLYFSPAAPRSSAETLSAENWPVLFEFS